MARRIGQPLAPATAGRLRVCLLAGGRERPDTVERIAQAVLLQLQVIAGLQVDPEPLRCAEETRQPQGTVRADTAVATHNILVPPARGPALPGFLGLAHRPRLVDILPPHPSR